MAESAREADVYDRVYQAERPELFFKATPHRVVGHGADVRIRADSPERARGRADLGGQIEITIEPIGTLTNRVR